MAAKITLEDIESAQWLISRGYVNTDDIYALAEKLADEREREERLKERHGEWNA